MFNGSQTSQPTRPFQNDDACYMDILSNEEEHHEIQALDSNPVPTPEPTRRQERKKRGSYRKYTEEQALTLMVLHFQNGLTLEKAAAQVEMPKCSLCVHPRLWTTSITV